MRTIPVAGVNVPFLNAENLVRNLQQLKSDPEIQLEALKRAKTDYTFSKEENEYLGRQIAALEDLVGGSSGVAAPA